MEDKNLSQKLPTFSLFKAPVMNVEPCRSVDVADIYKYITTSMEAWQATKQLRAITDSQEARKFKASHFDFATFSGVFSYRRDDRLVQHSGLLCLDFDHVGDLSALRRLRQLLLADTKFETWLLFISPSGDGLKWVISIDLSRCDHRTWFRALQNYVRQTYGLEVDEKCSNVSRTCFLPFDPLCYVHPDVLLQPDVCPF